MWMVTFIDKTQPAHRKRFVKHSKTVSYKVGKQLKVGTVLEISRDADGKHIWKEDYLITNVSQSPKKEYISTLDKKVYTKWVEVVRHL